MCAYIDLSICKNMFNCISMEEHKCYVLPYLYN